MSFENPACDELRLKIPTDWDVQPLDAVTDFQEGPGILAKDFRESGVPLLRLRNIEKPTVQVSGCNFLDVEKATSKWKHFGLEEGDLLISTSASLGRVSVVGKEAIGSIAYTGIIRFRSSSKRLHHEYLRAFLSSGVFVEQAEKMATGSVIRHFGPSHLKQMAITLPSLSEQVQVAEIFDALDDRITLLRETNATLEAIAQALFKSWFVDFDPVRAKLEGRAPEGMDEATAALFPDGFEESELGLVPRGWRVLRLGDATERITKGTTPTTLKRPFVDAGINFVKAESMTGEGGFIPEKFAFIDSDTYEILRRSQLQDGDVLISIAGTIGRIAVMTNDYLPANTNQAVALIRPLQHIFPSGLINRFLRLGTSQQQMREKVVQAVQANLSLGTLSDLKVVVPPQEVVSKLFESGLAQIDASWLANDQRVRTLATLRDTLLPRLISGQLRLPDVDKATAE